MYDGASGGRVTGRGENLMGKIASVIVAITLATGPLLLPVPAKAENGQIAAGVVGGLSGGGLIGGALAVRPAPPPPVYYAPAPGLVQAPACPFRWRRSWEG